MSLVEPIFVVLGPWRGGTSAVAAALRSLDVFMGAEFDFVPYTPHDTWEELRISHLLRRAFDQQTGQFQMDADDFREKLRSWADEHRRAASAAGCRPGVKHPLLCLALDFIRDAWGPVVPVVVDRPLADVVASLNKHRWFSDERERTEVASRLISARDLALADTGAVRVDFDDLRAQPAAVIRRLADQLRLDVTEAQLKAAAHSILDSGDARLGAPFVDPRQHIRDLRLAEVHRDPDNGEAVLRLAQACFVLEDFADALKWYERRVEMGGSPEEVHIAMAEIAHMMQRLGEPWPDVQDALLRAWEFRPTRAEPLYTIARWYRIERHFELGYEYARRAAEIPLPEQDVLFVRGDVYAWRATDEQAVCAAMIGKKAEAFTLFRQLLARPDIPEADRQRIASNRDMCVPAMIEAASPYPQKLVERLVDGSGDPEVLVSLVAGKDLKSTEQTLNSFLNCCTDVSRVGRFLVVDAGLSAEDRETLQERCGFLEFAEPTPPDWPREPAYQLTHLRSQIHERFWLHLSQGCQFFAPDNFITRLTAILNAEPGVFQVAINFTDAVTLTGACAAEETVRREPDTGRYVLTDVVAHGPAMFDTARLDRAGGLEDSDDELHTASLDEVLCVAVT